MPLTFTRLFCLDPASGAIANSTDVDVDLWGGTAIAAATGGDGE